MIAWWWLIVAFVVGAVLGAVLPSVLEQASYRWW